MSNTPIIITGDTAAIEGGAGNKIIVHCCGVAGWPSSSFSKRISDRWSDPEVRFMSWRHDGSGFDLGHFQLVETGEPNLWVGNVLLADENGEVLDEGWRGLGRLADAAFSLDRAEIHFQWEQLCSSNPAEQMARLQRICDEAGVGLTIYELR